ncbi:MAG TPA: hypothetical protein DIT58_15005 [Porticoccaceae bacterium]|nr:hypothetical protein [Porticoccaceae bacterium]
MSLRKTFPLAPLHREKNGRDQYLDTTLPERYLYYQEMNVQITSCTDGVVAPTRSGSHHFALSPVGIFQRAGAAYLHYWTPAFVGACGAGHGSGGFAYALCFESNE